MVSPIHAAGVIQVGRAVPSPPISARPGPCLLPGLSLLASLFLLAIPGRAVTVSPDELAAARQWVSARWQGRAPDEDRAPALVVLANHDPVQKNARGGRPLRIADREFTRGLYCHAPSRLIVRLPGPGRVFHAVVGVDSNEQTSGGRGSVEFVVSVGGAERFRSGVLREGMAGRVVQVSLDGAAELVLAVEPTADGIACDQSDWADARVTLEDGRELWLADLPLREAGPNRLFAPVMPFSFVYDGKPFRELVAGWERWAEAVPLDATRTAHTIVW